MLISDFPVVSVHIPPNLRWLAEGREEVMASGETVGDVLLALAHVCPALGARLICDDGKLASGLALYLGGRSLSYRNGLGTPVAQEEVLSLVEIGDLNCPSGTATLPVSRMPEAGGLISLGE